MDKKEKQLNSKIKQLEAGELLSDVLGLSSEVRDVKSNIHSVEDFAGNLDFLEQGINPNDPNAIEKLINKKYKNNNIDLVKSMDHKRQILEELSQKGRKVPNNAMGMVYNDSGITRGFSDIIPNDSRYTPAEKASIAIHENSHALDRLDDPSFKSLKRGYDENKVRELIKSGRTELEELGKVSPRNKTEFLQNVYKNPLDLVTDFEHGHHKETRLLGSGLAKNRIGKILGRSVKALPLIGGVAAAISSGDASAAIPILNEADSLDLPKDKPNRDVELGNTLTQEQYKELVRNSLKKISGNKE